MDFKEWSIARATYVNTCYNVLINVNYFFPELPTSFISNVCLSNASVKYLKAFNSKCTQLQIDEDNIFLNAESYFKNISVISVPELLNETKKHINNTVSIFFNISWQKRNSIILTNAHLFDLYELFAM